MVNTSRARCIAGFRSSRNHAVPLSQLVWNEFEANSANRIFRPRKFLGGADANWLDFTLIFMLR
jgi:hypothetical protein